MSLETMLAQAVQSGAIPGAVLLAASRSGVVNYSKVVGRRSLRPGVEDPLRLDTVLTLASMTKLLTTLCALQLSERGLLAFDDDVSQHIPVLARQRVLVGFSEDGSPILEDRSQPITMCHLLTHSSGAGYSFREPRLKQYVEYTKSTTKPTGVIDELFDLPLVHQPGDGWTYGTGISWAGGVIEKLTGQTLGAYMSDNIFTPLGITRITFFPWEVPALVGQVSDMTTRDPATGALSVGPPGLPSFPPLKDCLGGEGAYADLTEYIKVLHSLLLDDEKLLRKETTKLMFEPQLPTQAARDGLRMASDGPNWAIGDFSGPKEFDWGYGGLLIVGDAHPFRRRGYLSWSGAANLYWFIDRGAGVCGVWGTQVLPPSDPEVGKLISAFERHVYTLARDADSTGPHASTSRPIATQNSRGSESNRIS